MPVSKSVNDPPTDTADIESPVIKAFFDVAKGVDIR